MRIKNVIVSVSNGTVTPVRIPDGVRLVIRDIDQGKRIEYINNKI